MFSTTFQGDANLIRKLEDSVRNHTLTATERFEQKVSFVFGQMNHENGVTKDQVREMLKKSEGY